jgi:predicted site-specific integrase-resolvase
MMKLKEVASLLRISETTLRIRLKNQPDLLPKPINLSEGTGRANWRFYEDDIYNFMTKGNTKTVIMDE